MPRQDFMDFPDQEETQEFSDFPDLSDFPDQEEQAPAQSLNFSDYVDTPKQPPAFNPHGGMNLSMYQPVTSKQKADASTLKGIANAPALPTAYEKAWETAGSYIPQPVKAGWEELWKERTNAPTRAGKAVSDWFDPTQYGTYDPRRYLTAYPEALGQVVSGMSSIGNVATTALTGGAGTVAKYGGQYALPAAKGLAQAARVGGGLEAIHGGQTILDPNTSLFEKGLGGLESFFGVRGMKAPGKIGAGGLAEEALPVKPPVQEGGMESVRRGLTGPAIEQEPLVFDFNEPINRPKAAPEVSTSASKTEFGAEAYDDIQSKIAAGVATEEDLLNLEVINRIGAASEARRSVRPPSPVSTSPLRAETPAAPKPVLEFVDPNTGEIVDAANAKPGDVPITGAAPEAPMPVRPPAEAPMIPPPGASFGDWVKNLVKSETGSFDPDALDRGRYFAERRQPGESWDQQIRRERAERAARQAEPEFDVDESMRALGSAPDAPVAPRIPRVDPALITDQNRQALDRMDDVTLRAFIRRHANTTYSQTGLDNLNYARDIEDARIARREGTSTDTAPSGEGVPPWNRREMDEMRPESLQNYINRYAERSSPEARAIVEYGQRLIDTREGISLELRQDIEDLGLNNLSPSQASDAIRHYESAGRTDIVDFLTGRYQRTRGQTADFLAGRAGTYDQPPELPKKEFKGKSLEEVEEGKRTPALERLGRMIGEERAQKLVSGEEKIEFDERPQRQRGKKKLTEYDIQSWAHWGDSEVRTIEADPSQPGLTVKQHEVNLFPKAFEIQFRGADGTPMGVLRTNLDGSAIDTLAVSSKIGLRRGSVAFDMLKEAFDRGVMEPSGITSDLTKNLIERVKRLIVRASRTARSESGEIDVGWAADKINEIYDSITGSKAAQALKKFIKDTTGSNEIDHGLSRLKELYEKHRNGTITPEEIAEGTQLARAQGGEAAAPVRSPQVRFNALDGSAQIAVNDMIAQGSDIESALKTAEDLKLAKESTSRGYQQYAQQQNQVAAAANAPTAPTAPGATTPAPQGAPVARGAGYPQFGPTRQPRQGPVTPQGTMASGNPRTLQGNPQMQGNMPPVVRGATPAQLGPTRPPAAGSQPRKPVVPKIHNAVLDSLDKRIQKAIDSQGTPNAVAPNEISKMIKELEESLVSVPDEAKQGIIRKTLGANKALLTAWDLSAPGRQGKAFMLDKAWWTSLDDMIRAWGSDTAAKNIAQSIAEHPSGYFRRGVTNAGKPIKSWAERMGLDLAATEEAFSSKFGENFYKYSGINRASRAHTAFLNKLRSDQFVNMLKSAERSGIPVTEDLAKKYATFINDATGRGSVNVGQWKLDRNLNALNDAFFAPKNMAGQIRTWNNVLNPVKYWNYDSVMRKQALKSLFSVAGAGASVATMAGMAGADVNKDPRSSDFMKIKIGNTRIDLFGGYQQFPVAAIKFIGGKSIPTTGKNTGKVRDLTDENSLESRGSVAQRFFTNRLSPAGSFVWAWMFNKEFDGKPFEVKRALYERTLPIVMRDLYELGKEDPAMATMLSPLIVSGMAGTQTYTGRH